MERDFHNVHLQSLTTDIEHKYKDSQLHQVHHHTPLSALNLCWNVPEAGLPPGWAQYKH